MTIVQSYLVGMTLSLILSLIIVNYLSTPLTKLLVDLCGTEDRARFWAHLTNLSFVLMALLMSLIVRPDTGLQTIFQISRQLGWMLFGQIVTVVFVSMSISRFVYRVDRQNLNTQPSTPQEKK